MDTSSSSSTSTSTEIFQNILGNFHSRKLLLHNSLPHPQPPATAPLPSTEVLTAFENNIFLVLVVILCGVIGSIGVTYIFRCAFRCAHLFVSNSNESSSKLSMNKGVKEKALKTFPVVNYSVGMNAKFPGLDTECVICLSEFESGESLRLLPKCNHGFHVGCIDKWLKSHSSCPKCRQCLVDTCKKITSSGGDSSSTPTIPESNFVVVILAPESLMCNRSIS